MDQVSTAISFIPIITKSMISYYTVGPKQPSWSLRFHIVFSCLRHFLYQSNRFDRVLKVQELTRLPNPRTSPKAIVRTEKVQVRQEAIDFCTKHSLHIPVIATKSHEFVGEWVSATPNAKNVVYLLHGGAFIVGSPQMERKLAYYLAKQGDTQTFAISYRLAPQYEFPCALIDAISGYLHLLSLGCKPEQIVFSGASAGGGLVLSTLLALREMGVPLPSGAIAMSPWVDLTHSFPSFLKNKETDYLPSKSRITFGDRVHPYAPNEILDLQYVSPLWASNLSIGIPVLIQLGQVERLFDEGMAMGTRLQKESIARIEIYQEQVHVFQVFEFLASSKTAMARCGDFIKDCFAKNKIMSETVFIDPQGRIQTPKAKL